MPRPFSFQFQMRRLSIYFFSALLAGANALYGTGLVEPRPHQQEVAERFAKVFPRRHMLHLPIDDDISSKAWTNFLFSLDRERLFFRSGDIAEIRSFEHLLDDHMEEGILDFPYEVFELFKNRARDRYQYVISLLDKGFDLEKKENYRWKRDEQPWAQTASDWNELWRKKIKDEYLRIVVAGELASEDEDEDEDDDGSKTTDKEKTPEERIKERYKQFLTVLEDNDSEWILQKYLSEFAQAYDPHSDYLSPSTVENFDIEMKLSLVGIGALLRSEDGAAKVVRVIPGGPADRDKRKKQLEPGDKIIAVAQGDEEPVSVLHWPLHKTVRLIRGEKGTKVVLKVIPASDPTGTITKEVDLIRDEVKLEEQAAKLEIEKATGADGKERVLGVINLPAFYRSMNSAPGDEDFRSSSHDVRRLINQAVEKGIEGLLLDLRGNGGGSLMEAVDLVGLFIVVGPVVQVKDSFFIRAYSDEDPAVAYEGPLVVLVSRLSASASEIAAAALQDYGRALVLGDSKTHGKGSVQTILELGRDPKLGKIKVTSALYYRVSGGSTQLKGVEPDIVIPSAFDRMDFGEEHLRNAIPWSTVPRADYFPVGDAGAAAPLIRKRMEERWRNDERFEAHKALLKRIEEINSAEVIPLDIETRRQMASAEKELSDLRDSLVPEGMSDESETVEADEKEKNDIVLRESLRALADLVELERKGITDSPLSVTRPTAKRTLDDLFKSWLKYFN